MPEWADGEVACIDGVETLTRHVLFAEVKRAILSLPEPHREMLTLWSQGWSLAHIAEVNGISKAWACQIINETIGSLRRKLN